jgi:pimeloyl-ACP methyl ester carboxylesterase
MKGGSILRTESAYQLICILAGIVGFVAYAMSKFVPGRTIVVVTASGVLAFTVALGILGLRLKRPRAVVKAVATTLLAVLLGSYATLFVVIDSLQDRIADETSAFFQPQPLSAEAAEALISPRVEPIDLATPDGARLRGWLVRNLESERSPLIIYFDGSGSESSQMIPYVQGLKGRSVALVNYRGFGLSEGVPSQAHAFADAVFLYDTFSKRPDVDASRIVAMGYSLGTGVAVYLSEQRPVAGTILVAPYDSLTLIGVKRPIVYAPLSGIMKRTFDSISRAPAITSPMLCLIGSADTSVPPESSRRLVDQWGGRTTVKMYQGEDHGLLLHDNSSWADIAVFLQSIE